MSEYQPLQQHDLAQVLQRINALVQQQQPAPGQPIAEQVAAVEAVPVDQQVPDEDAVPLLTETYQGDLAALQVVAPLALDGVQQVVQEVVQQLASQPEQVLPEQLAARFLAEVQPLILKAVKVAVLEESVKAEKLLTGKLEQDILQLLQQRLTAALPPSR